MLAGELGNAYVDLGAIPENRALLRRYGRQLRSAWACGEIGVRLLLCDALHLTLDPHLTAERLPLEQERCARVRIELAGLPADVAGEEDEAPFISALQQHHPHRGRAVNRRRGERHRLRRLDFRPFRVGVPTPELLQRVGLDGRFP